MQLTYDGPSTLRANQLFTARLRVIPGRELHGGDRLVLAVRHMSDLGDPQTRDPRAENYVTVAGSGTWELGPVMDWRRHPWNRGIELRLTAGVVRAEEELTLTLGDRDAGSPGYRGQSFAETKFAFRLGLLAGGEPDWQVMEPEACPTLRVTGNQAVGLRVVVSQPTPGGGALRVHVKPEDAFGNVAHDGPDEVTLLADDIVPIGRVALRPDEPAVAMVPCAQNPSWQRLTAATADGRFWARSNPVGPSPMDGYRLFFGEIHAQSSLCDGTNTPAELYRYARDAAGLDFAAVTSHDFELTAEDWKQIQQATRAAHRPGAFVTFLGYEWSGQVPAGGDNNIYFLDDEAPLVYSAPFGGYGAWDPAQGQVTGSRTLAETMRGLRGRRFMVVPHCGGRQCNLDYYDRSVMPLFEIHSCHRTYEDVARESLRRGLRFGFIGGSDDHRGAPGDSHPAARERFFSSHNGLAAVYATDLTRESLWEAFFARRVYATNGPRIVLTIAIDGRPMGSEIAALPGARLKLSFATWLDGSLDRIEVMRDETLLKTFAGPGNQIDQFAGEVDVQGAAEPHAYYVRVFQTDGGRAWSSPIWVAPPADPGRASNDKGHATR